MEFERTAWGEILHLQSFRKIQLINFFVCFVEMRARPNNSKCISIRRQGRHGEQTVESRWRSPAQIKDSLNLSKEAVREKRGAAVCHARNAAVRCTYFSKYTEWQS